MKTKDYKAVLLRHYQAKDKTVSMFAIDMLAFWMNDWYVNKSVCEKKGSVQVYSTGNSNVNGFQIAANKASANIQSLFRQLKLDIDIQNELMTKDVSDPLIR